MDDCNKEHNRIYELHQIEQYAARGNDEVISRHSLYQP